GPARRHRPVRRASPAAGGGAVPLAGGGAFLPARLPGGHRHRRGRRGADGAPTPEPSHGRGAVPPGEHPHPPRTGPPRKLPPGTAAVKALVQKLVDGLDLTPAEVEAAFESIFQGEATPAQMGAFLVALRMKGETPAEIAAAAEVMRRRAKPVRTPAGRLRPGHGGAGGERRGTFKPLPGRGPGAGGAGVAGAKECHRGVASRGRSGDGLAACGVPLDGPVETVGGCLGEVGIGFLYAP